MGLIKTMALVGVSVGVGAWVGDKAFGTVGPKLPASVTETQRAGARLGLQAAAGVGTFAILRSVVGG